MAGAAAGVQDGQFFIWLAGIAPAVLFLALEKLRRSGRSAQRESQSVALAALFALGSVYFFSAVQGTVWYAAHVVAAGLAALYLLFALDAERPLLAGLCLALGCATRAPLIFAAPLFLLEAARAQGFLWPLGQRAAALTQGSRLAPLLQKCAWFCLPLALVVGLTAWHNWARFGSVGEVGYRYLSIVWQKRVETWGLFSYHYLGRNLAVILTSLPWLPPRGEPASAPFQINAHGLALWVTTPIYLWLFYPAKSAGVVKPLLLSALLVALPTLFYQNTGWLQFGYRFSNDFSIFLFACLACTLPQTWSPPLYLAALSSLLINGFGALSFGRPTYAAYYFVESTQRVLHQPD
jgi:hypothetical protein